ncbi:hypothetical protein CJU90_3884 [Yarrowia sp. C11]|nr:hypothetical protein CKK34_5495 [Yarrowia sp. E02]KAG5367584.1 hypothetical protein CJU90_3884 [Yarrowia sp. C11]
MDSEKDPYVPARLPTEILLKILDHLELADLIAYSDSCQTYRTDLLSIDTPYVRNRVQKRVPWMQIEQAGSDLSSWRDAARLVLSRADSMMTARNEKWTSFMHADFSHHLPYHQTEYLEPVDLNGPLPADFEPLFGSSQFKLPCPVNSHVDGHLLHFNRRQFNLKTFVCSVAPVEEVVEPKPKKRKVGRPVLKPPPQPVEPPFEHTFTCPSGLKVSTSHENSTIRCLGENERVVWIWELRPDPRQRKQRLNPLRMQYLIDKPSCSRTHDGTTLLFDRHHESSLLVPHETDINNVLFPGNSGLVGFTREHSGSSEVLIMYYDPDPKNRFVRQLASVTHGQAVDMEVVAYEGVLYVYKQDVLTPLWADLEYHTHGHRLPEPLFAKLGFEDLRSDEYVQANGPMKVVRVATGVRPEMKAMNLVQRRVPETGGGRTRLLKLHFSSDKRFVASHLSGGRIVADLSTATTYIVRDEGDEDTHQNFVFVGRKNDKPVFYRWKRDFGLGFLSNLEKIQKKDRTSFYLMPNPDASTDLTLPVRADLPAPVPLMRFSPGTAAFSRVMLGMDPNPPPPPPPPKPPIIPEHTVQDQKALERDMQLKGGEVARLGDRLDSRDRFESFLESLAYIESRKEVDLVFLNKRKSKIKLYRFDRPRWRI